MRPDSPHSSDEFFGLDIIRRGLFPAVAHANESRLHRTLAGQISYARNSLEQRLGTFAHLCSE